MNYVGSYRGKRWEADVMGRSVTISVAQPGPNARFEFEADPSYEAIEAMAWTFMENRCDDLSGPTPVKAAPVVEAPALTADEKTGLSLPQDPEPMAPLTEEALVANGEA